MKFYSEQTKKLYDTKDELTKAEAELATKKEAEMAKKAERTAAAKEVEDALKKARDAQKEADKKLADFCKKYGSFHTTVNEVIPSAFDTLFDWLWF